MNGASVLLFISLQIQRVSELQTNFRMIAKIARVVSLIG